MPRYGMKEEERIERVIRGLLKLPENKRCINCNSLGPQYVCTTFWTFVCTNCSGVHREFTHRVKSVSMAKFSSEEVTALQAGGNERARQLYFNTWDYQRDSFPDASNLHRLRNFIKHVYVDRKYTGERINDKLSVDKAGAKDNYSERHSHEKSSYGARDGFECHSLEMTDRGRRDDFYDRRSIPRIGNDDRNLRSHVDDRSSPQYRHEKLRSARSRAAHFEIVDDRFREAGFGTVKTFENHRLSNAESRARSSSPVSEKSKYMTSPPKIRPVKEILGNNFPPLKVGEPPKANDGRNIKSSAPVQKATRPTSPSSLDKKDEENKTVNTCSLIDFDSNPDPTATRAVVQTEEKAPSADVGHSPAPSSTNEKVSTTPNVNPLESLLFELAGPVNASAGGISERNPGGDTPSAATAGLLNVDGVTVYGSTTDAPVLSSDIGSTNASRIENVPAFPSSGSNPIQPVTDTQQLPSPTMQQNQSFAIPAGNCSSTAQQTTSSLQAFSNQPLASEPAHDKRSPTDASSEKSVSIPAHNTNSGNESVSSGRKELPAGLFTSSHSSFAASVPEWQFRPPYGMGYGMQYPPTAMAPHNSIKSANPFDLGAAGHHVQAAMFPSMSSLQGALQSMSDSPGLWPQAEPYLSAFHPQGTSHGMIRPPGAYMGQQIPNNMISSRPQGTNNVDGNNGDAFASLNPIQQSSGTNPKSVAPNSFLPSGGNPFG